MVDRRMTWRLKKYIKDWSAIFDQRTILSDRRATFDLTIKEQSADRRFIEADQRTIFNQRTIFTWRTVFDRRTIFNQRTRFAD